MATQPLKTEVKIALKLIAVVLILGVLIVAHQFVEAPRDARITALEKAQLTPSIVPSQEPTASISAVPVITTAPVLVPAKPVIKSVVPSK